MNCPKCGSKNIRMEDKFDEFTVYHCNKCNDYFATYEWAIKVDEPSTAEKLLWLDDSGIEVTIEDRKNGRRADYFVGNEYESKTLAEAIYKEEI